MNGPLQLGPVQDRDCLGKVPRRLGLDPARPISQHDLPGCRRAAQDIRRCRGERSQLRRAAKGRYLAPRSEPLPLSADRFPARCYHAYFAFHAAFLLAAGHPAPSQSDQPLGWPLRRGRERVRQCCFPLRPHLRGGGGEQSFSGLQLLLPSSSTALVGPWADGRGAALRPTQVL